MPLDFNTLSPVSQKGAQPQHVSSLATNARNFQRLTFLFDSFFLSLFDLLKQGLFTFFLELGFEELVLALLDLNLFRGDVSHLCALCYQTINY